MAIRYYACPMSQKSRPLPPSDTADKFVLRLPDGLRERIKVYAEEHGRSMNAEIVRILEREFPEPWPLDTRLKQLLTLTDALREVVDGPKVDALGGALVDTLKALASGQIPGLDRKARSNLAEWVSEWQAEFNYVDADEYEASLDPEEIENRDTSGSTAKIVLTDKPKAK